MNAGLRTFVERSGELHFAGKVKDRKGWSRRETEFNWASSQQGADPKPGDLPMSRLKPL